MKRKPLTVVGFMEFTDTGRVVPLEELTPEEWEYCRKKILERQKLMLPQVFLNNPEAFDLLPDAPPKRAQKNNRCAANTAAT